MPRQFNIARQINKLKDLFRMSMAIGFIWILMVPNGWHSLLKLHYDERCRRLAF